MTLDIINSIIWWLYIFIIGVTFFPITSSIFPRFIDKGYIFSKTLGLILLSYSIFALGIYNLLEFNRYNLILIFCLYLIASSIILYKKLSKKSSLLSLLKNNKKLITLILTEEVLFTLGLALWIYVRSFAPEIHGLEKFMDYGFINSIIRTHSFPPTDMWFASLPINYYYFGHLVTSSLTILSNIPSYYTYNLMLATILGLCFTSVFSIVLNLTYDKINFLKSVVAGFLGGLIVSFAGNLHTIYTFFTPYDTENPVSPVSLKFNPTNFPNNYWYPNATRFIHNTIHEFPLYSWVVADLHGHVLDIPIVLLTIAVLLSLYMSYYGNRKNESGLFLNIKNYYFILVGFLLSVMYMTNAWDGAIYLIPTFFIILTVNKNFFNFPRSKLSINYYKEIITINKISIANIFIQLGFVFISFVVFTHPFNEYFNPFVSGIGLLCAPDFLTNIGKFGPILFEKDHCQVSPAWQLLMLHGFYFVFTIIYLIFLIKQKIKKTDIFVLILIITSFMLIFIPEFIYAKDIYPAHYRANTMFKLVFQSFIMLGISSAFIIHRILTAKIKRRILKVIFALITLPLLSLVFIYPFMAINSYYGDLKTYKGLDGRNYIQEYLPSDYKVINWLQENITDQPVILEAQGDSYTDYARISANTGLPTVLGWTVHEWLWRGTYDITVPRINDVQKIYETEDINEAKNLLRKYGVQYVIIGNLEREKYPNIRIEKFLNMGNIVFQDNLTYVIKINDR